MRQTAEAPFVDLVHRVRCADRRVLVMAVLLVAAMVGNPAGAQVGTPDPTFDGDGIVITDLNPIDRAYGVLARLDGTVLAVGETQPSNSASRAALLVEYGPGGAVVQSRTYNALPGCSVPEGLYAIEPEAGADVVVGGYLQNGCSGQHQLDFWLLRLDADFDVALAFDRPVFFGNYDEVRDLAIQPDGKIVAVGVAATSVAEAGWSFGVARWNPNGTLDTSGFGTGGEVVIDFAGSTDFARGVAIQPDGKIVVVGYAFDGGVRKTALARLLADGTLDATFGTGGRVTTSRSGLGDQANDVVVLESGAILVAGTSVASDGVGDAVVLRYLADGTLDPSFGTGGTVVVDLGFRPAGLSQLLVQYDGKLVVAGTTQTGADVTTRDVAVARLNADGTPDPSFNGGDARTVDATGQEDVGVALALQPWEGHLVVAGYSVLPTVGDPVYDVAMVRLIGDAGLLIFADGFESGDTTAWSATVPP